MTTAKEMFEELSFTTNDERATKEIKDATFFSDDYIYISGDKNNKAFIVFQMGIKSVYTYGEYNGLPTHESISTDLLKAIIKQEQEWGWLDD